MTSSSPAAEAETGFWRNTKRLFWLFFTLWWVLFGLFHYVPSLDIASSSAFFQQTMCPPGSDAARICGMFPYAGETVFKAVRRVFFYVPAASAVLLLIILLRNLQHHGATYSKVRTRRISIALIALFIGPYVLVNLILKTVSGRPRPNETDMFGGFHPFSPAGSFSGACENNCSFISGEAAGAGWVACLIFLLPKRLRPTLGPPILAISIMTPALRLAFGGHFLSDVVLGWLSSLVIYLAITLYFEMSQSRKKSAQQAKL